MPIDFTHRAEEDTITHLINQKVQDNILQPHRMAEAVAISLRIFVTGFRLCLVDVALFKA